MSLQSPLNKVLGYGSAKKGSGHWWSQRLTAVALIPLALWFSVFLIGIAHGDHAAVTASVARPLNAILLILFLLTLLYHSSLGLQVVIEDYVHAPAAKIVSLVTMQFIHAVLAVGGLYAIVTIAVGGAA